MHLKHFLAFIALLLFQNSTKACSILYYVDAATKKVYAVNNEDYWYDVDPYIKIVPVGNKSLARLWYGWNNFAQGGINEAGLFFDGATTPDQKPIEDYNKPSGNLGDKILASCKTTNDAIRYMEEHKIALTNGHLLFGDKSGNAVVVEWVNGKKHLTPISDNQLFITNFLLADTTQDNYPCPRYDAIRNAIASLRKDKDSVTLKDIGGVAAKAVQQNLQDGNGKNGGTLYSTFVDITDMQFILVFKLDNSKKIELDLRKEFENPKARKINLE